MSESQIKAVGDAEHDEGELNSDDESRESSSEGLTTDGEDSNEVERTGKHSPTLEETPWERGLRLARDRARKMKIMRQTDVDLEEKRLNFTVFAPDPNEDHAYANVCGTGRPDPADAFWPIYHKLAIIGCTQLTCRRSLPRDLSLPSQRTVSRWRRSFGGRARSSEASAHSIASSHDTSLASSLSSLAGSILFAVPDLVLADESDREGHSRRRPHGDGRSSSRKSSSSSGSISGTGSRSSRCVSSSRSYSKAKRKRSHSRGIYSASSSSVSPAAVSNSLLRRKDRSLRRDSRPIVTPRSRGQSHAWRDRRSTRASHGDKRDPAPPLAIPKISGYRHQQSSFSKSAIRNGENGRNSFGDSNRRSPDRPPPMPSARPVKRPWLAEPPKSKNSSTSAVQPPCPRSQQSGSRPVSHGSPLKDNVAVPTTCTTPWSQSQGRQTFSNSTLPNFIPLQTMPSPSRKRAVSFRRKSRSPFADSYFGNPPAPVETVLEQSVPLLAGAVNPDAPPSSWTAATKTLLYASARPGVRLKIAPRFRGGLALPESALERAHRDSNYKVSGSPVSSVSSGGRAGPFAPGRRRKPGPTSTVAAKRMRRTGYTAVSPGGFESPPPPPPLPSPSLAAPNRAHLKSRQLETRQTASGAQNRTPEQGRSTGNRSRDRVSRTNHAQSSPERNRGRQPPPPQPERINRSRSSRVYNEDSQYLRSRGEKKDSSRSYGASRHGGGNRRQVYTATSRSPFDGRAGGKVDQFNNAKGAKGRLSELRQGSSHLGRR